MFSIKNIKAIGTILALFLLLSPTSHGSAYKWIDEEGGTHYSQQPPADTTSEEIQPRGYGSNPNHPNNDLKEKIRALEQQKDLKKQETDEAAKTEEREKARQEFCKKLEANLAVLKTKSRVTQREDGEVKVLSEEEKQAMMSDIQERIEKNCK